MLVKDLMQTPVVSVSPVAGLDRALIMMKTKRIRHLPVVDDGALVGIITDRDLRLCMVDMELEGPRQAPKGMYLPALKKVREVMKTNVFSVAPDDPVNRAVELMSEHKIGGLPVLEPESKKVVGMITETDLLRLLRKLLEEKDG